MDKKKMKQKRLDRIGILCGVLVLVVAVLSAAYANRAPASSVPADQIPESAVTLTGSAEGRNGPVTVEIIADAEKIYSVRVLEHNETEGIGSEAVKQLPAEIFQAQNVMEVDAVSGATITTTAIQQAAVNALTGTESSAAGISPKTFGANPVKAELLAQRADEQYVETLKQEGGGHIQVVTAANWAEEYPNQYRTWKQNEENDGQTDYLVDYPMLSSLYNYYGFAFDYMAARGHSFDVEDISETARPHGAASCWTCKTPLYTAMVLEEGSAAYAIPFDEAGETVAAEPISCFNCHANSPLNEKGEVNLVVTHTYLIDGVGEDFDSIDAANLACGQCHNEYFFDPNVENKPTTLPHNSLASMHPDAILAYYNAPNWDGLPYADFTNPDSGVRQIKVQHPELETFLGEGSPHRNKYSCADCHMGKEKDESGKTYSSHYLISPLDNETLIQNECSKCHTDLVKEVRAVQDQVEARTYSIGYELMFLNQRIAEAAKSGSYTEERLNEIRQLARDAQFYWDFVFVENAEGAHNPKLTYYCLDKAEELCNQAMAKFDRIIVEKKS
jgi:nitrite reductase (cytochrome c-552)